MKAEIDNYPVSELQNRYSLGKQAVYNRLDALEIKPFKERNRSYISADQVQMLDDLHEHIKAGGTMADFSVARKELTDRPLDKLESPLDRGESPLDTVGKSSLSTQTVNFGELVAALASQIQPRSPLWYMDELKRAASEDWLLTTVEVRELIGVKPTARQGSDTYKRGCWLFTKAGKIGNQTAWRVTKQ